MKTVRMRLFHSFAALASMLFMSTGLTNAQTFNGASLAEYPYPVPGTLIPGLFPNPVNTTTHTADYTMSHIAYMNPWVAPPAGGPPYTPAPPMPVPPTPPGTPWLSDLCLHSWDDPNSTAGIAWINKANASGVPGTIYDQGFMMYPSGVQDIEMTLQQDQMGYNMFIWGTNAPWYVIVSFYNSNPANYAGVGHYVEYYIWNNPIPIGTGGLTFVNRVQLSAIPNYTRIRQDGHNTYGFTITWDDPTPGPLNGINYVMGFMNLAIPGVSLSPVYVLAGTKGWNDADVCISHDNMGLNNQFVYQRTAGGLLTIREAFTAFVLGPAWPPGPAIIPTINDNNIIPWGGGNPVIKSHIDCPDHYGWNNWAYVYTLPPYNQISVRFMNCNPGPCVPTTYVVNNGSMGNVACDVDASGVTWQNDFPTLSFDATASRLNVGWYTAYDYPAGTGFFLPNTGGYVDLQMDETGLITTPLDYMQVASGFTGSNLNASTTPSMAFSRQNDRTDYHYPVFANNMCPGPAAQIQTKERPWMSPAFKGGGQHEFWKDIYKASVTTKGPVTDQLEEMSAYPNPFSSKVSLLIPANLRNQELTVTVQDITGREIERFKEQSEKVNLRLEHLGDKLANGTYLINVNSKDNAYNKTIKIERLADK